MAICNRDMDPSQQTFVITNSVTKTITGTTYALVNVPFPCQLLAAQQQVAGLSGAPNLSLWLQRFVPGVGITSIAVGASMVSVVWATSGGQSFNCAAAGVTFPLQTGDLLVLSTAAANTAAEYVSVTLVVKALQDIKTVWGA